MRGRGKAGISLKHWEGLGIQEVSESSAVQNMCKELVDQNAQGKWTQFQDLKIFVSNWIKGSCSF